MDKAENTANTLTLAAAAPVSLIAEARQKRGLQRDRRIIDLAVQLLTQLPDSKVNKLAVLEAAIEIVQKIYED